MSSGTASTSYSVAPTITSPLSTAISATVTTANTVSGPVVASSGARTTTLTPSIASKTFSASASDLWSQNWAFQPVTDPEKLRRLRALYAFAVDGREDLLRKRYPLISKTMAISQPTCLTNEITNQPLVLESHGNIHRNADFFSDGELKNKLSPKITHEPKSEPTPRAGADDPPIISGPKPVSVTVRQPTNIEITVSDTPMDWTQEGLPDGLQLDKQKHLITGIPTGKDGLKTYRVTLKAKNAAGWGPPYPLEITVQAPQVQESAGKDIYYHVCVTSVGGSNNPSSSAGSRSYSVLVPDEHYLMRPRCVLCLRRGYLTYAGKNSLVVNEKSYRTLAALASAARRLPL